MTGQPKHFCLTNEYYYIRGKTPVAASDPPAIIWRRDFPVSPLDTQAAFQSSLHAQSSMYQACCLWL